MRHLLLIAALASIGLLPAGEPAEASAASFVGSPTAPVARDAISASAAMDGALREAVRAEFPNREVRIRLGSPRVSNAAPEQREVRVHGRLMLDHANGWVDFGMTALYDQALGTATATTLSFDTPETVAAVADAELSARLVAETSRRLHAEFVDQPAQIDLESVEVRPIGTYLAVLADGHADFGVEGRASATVRALYDPRAQRWLQLDYELGDGNSGS